MPIPPTHHPYAGIHGDAIPCLVTNVTWGLGSAQLWGYFSRCKINTTCSTCSLIIKCKNSSRARTQKLRLLASLADAGVRCTCCEYPSGERHQTLHPLKATTAQSSVHFPENSLNMGLQSCKLWCLRGNLSVCMRKRDDASRRHGVYHGLHPSQKT